MTSPLSADLRSEVLSLIELKSTTAFIKSATGVTLQQINKMKRNVRNNGAVTPLSEKTGRKPLLSAFVVEDLLGYLSQRPTALLDEIRWFL
jgi:hypothetical protein